MTSSVSARSSRTSTFARRIGMRSLVCSSCPFFIAPSSLLQTGDAQGDARAVLFVAGAALDDDAPAVGGDDLPNEQEREPLGVHRSLAPFEQVRQLGLWNAGAVVVHGDRDVGR